MNRGNKLLLGILVFIVVCVMGYGLFSDTISVTGSATASGNLKIITTCTPGYSDEFLVFYGNPEGVTNDTGQGGFENSICNVNGTTISATTDLLYPTARRIFTVKMTNTGSIPVIIWGSERYGKVDSLYTNDSASYSLINSKTGEIIKSGSMNSSENRGNPFVQTGVIGPVLENGTLGKVIYDSIKGYAGIKMDTNESIYITIEFDYGEKWSKDLSDNGISEYYEFKLNHEFKWEQFVDSPNYEEADFNNFCFDGC